MARPTKPVPSALTFPRLVAKSGTSRMPAAPARICVSRAPTVKRRRFQISAW